MAVPCIQVEKCEKCLNYYPIKSVHQCMHVTVEEPRKLKKILPAVCIGDKVQPFINLSDFDRDQNKVNDKITLCLINAIKARRPLFDHTIPLSERSESIKNKLWNEVYDELQGQITTDELKKKWKYLKEKYVRERQKAKKSDPKGGRRTKWLHYVQLSFLEEVLTQCHDKNNLNLNSNNHSEDSPQSLTTAKEQKRKEKNNYKRRLLNEHTISRPTLPTRLNEEPHDSDVAFGKYIVALMKDIPIKKRKKLQYQFIASLISAQDPE
ncbi:uncharacterized protein LOC100167001 [Acyrthosiphon pisum]|uniref:MADF domain-containing protein n=1 Tax=Acyrthosiphon pisum TaxID=7029 RepID=A0A8R2A9V3_ACYPI|nr:uncharacterized protein LOC100167001 [Acyrthosiphon pisum]|eukprot:XP_001952093.1 PREDICTED: uncharacterized protein LOC100167001 [Acyrthosiphon pisum]